jgi:radical SAM protein with 4Fe4S-binding SPASM domain
VVTTLTKRSLAELPALHDLLVGQVYAWQLQLGAAMGNLHDHRSEQLDSQDLLTLVPIVAELMQERKVNIHVGDNVGYYGPHEAVLRAGRKSSLPHWVGCYAGCRHVGIEADGGVKGCLSLQCTTKTEGNLQRESLRDIWLRPGAFAYNRGFRLADLGGFCRSCQYAETCRGGCLSMRSCEGGRDNPFCYHRVATLAQREKRSRSLYVPIAVAPAALLVLLGFGCEPQEADLYGCPPPCEFGGPDGGKDGATDSGATDALGEYQVTPVYGIPAPEGGEASTDAPTDVTPD